MFSPDIVSSDAFLEMSATARDLYFQLGMFADDDGFVNPRKYMRMLGSSEDDLKILLGKRFLLPFASGVVVVKHWRINNLVRKDWYKPTQYLDEKSLLFIKENGVYTDNPENGIPLVNDSLTNRQHRLGKVSIGNNTASEDGQRDSIVPFKVDARAEARSQKIAAEGYDSRDTKAIRLAAEKKFGIKFPNAVAQETHIKSMLKAGFSGEEQIAELDRLLSDEFWGEKGVDFKTVSGQIGKAKRKKFNKVSVSEDIRL